MTVSNELSVDHPVAAAIDVARWRVEWRETALLTLAIIVVPTLAYAFMADRFGFVNPRLNFDLFAIYLLCVEVARRRPRLAPPLALICVFLTLAIQVLLGVGAIYLDNAALFLEYLSFAAYWPWRLISFWAAIAAAVFGVYYLLIRKIPMERARLLPVLVALGALIVVDLIGRTSIGYETIGRNVATSSLSRGSQYVSRLIRFPSFTAVPIAEPMMVAEVTSGTPPPRILSLSVEALGLAKDEAFNAAIIAPMERELAGLYEVEIGRHDFEGPTLSGEIRELCGQRAMGKPTQAAALALRKSCLPAILAAQGYETVGMHGNPRFFYNRASVYPAFGFGSTRFYEDFESPSRPDIVCRTRSFEGVCDREVMRAALDFLSARPKAYAHIMTLDTHFPLGPNALGDERCGRVRGLTDSDLCLYANQMANLFAMFAREIRAAENAPDVVFLFGDHGPPYVTVEDREYFDRKRVPFITLRKIVPDDSPLAAD